MMKIHLLSPTNGIAYTLCNGGLMAHFFKNTLRLFCTYCLCSSAQADDLDLFSRLYLSDKSYAKHIEIQAFLATRDQVVQLFCNEKTEILQKNNRELYGKELFLLLRVKNNGDYMSRGLLNCTIPNRGTPITMDIEMMPGHMKSFHDSALYLGDGLVPNDIQTPLISLKWKSLYTM